VPPLDRDGGVVAAPDPDASEVKALKTDHPCSVAVDAMHQAAAPTIPAAASHFMSM